MARMICMMTKLMMVMMCACNFLIFHHGDVCNELPRSATRWLHLVHAVDLLRCQCGTPLYFISIFYALFYSISSTMASAFTKALQVFEFDDMDDSAAVRARSNVSFTSRKMSACNINSEVVVRSV